MGCTITHRGTVTIPSKIRKEYNLKRGFKVKFVESDEGIPLVPVVPLEQIFGVDRERKELVCQIIRELEEGGF
jgi:AbrB family looped-hinge helix DNA binding protein